MHPYPHRYRASAAGGVAGNVTVLGGTFDLNGVESNEKVSGLGILIGTGADIRLSRKFSLSPIASWYMAAVGDLDTAQGLVNSVSANTWFIGMGLTLN